MYANTNRGHDPINFYEDPREGPTIKIPSDVASNLTPAEMASVVGEMLQTYHRYMAMRRGPFKCYGGPLEGRDAPFPQMAAFPWPQGWYYFVPEEWPGPMSPHYRWQEGAYTPNDEQWLRDTAPGFLSPE